MVHAPIPPCYPLPLKGWQLHHSESRFWSQYLAAQWYFFIFFHWAAEIRDPTDITEFTLFPLLPVLSLLLSSEGSVWPPTLCCYFQYKISIQGLLDASQCLFSTPPTRLSLNARQIEHFRDWHFSRTIFQYHAPCESIWKLIQHVCMTVVISLGHILGRAATFHVFLVVNQDSGFGSQRV